MRLKLYGYRRQSVPGDINERNVTRGGAVAVLKLLLTSVVLCYNNFLNVGGEFLFRCY